MDLKKLFVYVPAAAEASFITNVINNPEEAAKYSNKIVFLENSNRIWVKGVFYGTDLETLDGRFSAIWTALGFNEEDGFTAGSYTVGSNTYSYEDFKEWIEALKSYTDAKIAAEKAEVVTAYEAADSAIISGYQGADSAIISSYEAADTAIISSYEAADSAIISGYQGADSAIISAYEAADAALEAKLPGVAAEGSGITVRTSVDEQTGKVTYTVVADQSIWEFMGAAEATSATVATVLDGKYGDGEGQVHRAKEAGDVWAVTITDQSNNVILYAYDGANWVQIGSAQGISGVDTTVSHGIGLTNTASIVGLTITDGAIDDGVTYFITGNTAYTKFNEVIAAYEAADEAIITAYEAADEAIINAYEAADEAIVTAYEAADSAIISGYQGADTAIISSYEAADTAIISGYQGADSAIITAYETADANIKKAMANSVAGNSADSSYLTVTDGGETANGHTYTINFNEQAMFNYVSDNIWETYAAS